MGAEKQRFSSACCWPEASSRQRNNGWFLRTPGSVSWSGSRAQFARDLSVGVSTPILLFFLLGGVALHERLVGKLGLMYQPDWPGPDKFEVDYELDPAWWGRGLATEGTQAALRYGFMERSLPRIIGATVPEHVASRRVMEKCGLSYQGELWFRNARIVWYALDASTWRSLTNTQK